MENASLNFDAVFVK